jgi:membrane protein required for colicin V production
VTLVDYILLGVLGFFFVLGIRRGGLRQCTDIGAILGGLYIASRYHTVLGNQLGYIFRIPDAYQAIAGFVVIWALALAVVLGLGMLLHRLVHLTALGPVNRVLGGVLGSVKGLCIMIPCLIALLALETPGLHNSAIIRYTMPWIEPIADACLDAAIPAGPDWYPSQLTR